MGREGYAEREANPEERGKGGVMATPTDDDRGRAHEMVCRHCSELVGDDENDRCDHADSPQGVCKGEIEEVAQGKADERERVLEKAAKMADSFDKAASHWEGVWCHNARRGNWVVCRDAWGKMEAYQKAAIMVRAMVRRLMEGK